LNTLVRVIKALYISPFFTRTDKRLELLNS